MTTPNPDHWIVDIEDRGRCGTVHYREGQQGLSFYWEFGGDDVVAIIECPDFSDWDQTYPWAAGRRLEVMERVAGEAIRQKAPRCRADLDPRSGCIRLREGD